VRNFITCTLRQNDQVKEDEMGRACSTNGEKRKCIWILVEKPDGKRPVSRQRRRWVDNIKMECGYDVVVLTGLIWLRMGASEGLF
jgi:hypothetical protein